MEASSPQSEYNKFSLMRAILIFIIFLLPKSVFSCDCIENTIEKAINTTELILRGKFVEVNNNPFPLLNNETKADRLYFEGKIIVLEVLKGNGINIGDTVSVESDYSNCSVYYKMNAEYLFFASSFKKGIMSDGCSFTTQLFDLSKDERYNRTINLLKLK